MDPRKISELASFFRERALFPKRSLSQNFLIDKNVLEKIAKEAEKQLKIVRGDLAETRMKLDDTSNQNVNLKIEIERLK